MHDTVIPGLGVLHPWQWAFVIVGLPGVFVALLVHLTVKEPARRGRLKTQTPGARTKDSMPIGQVLKYIADDWPCFGPIFVGMAVRSLGLGAAAWLPEFFRRTYDWAIPQIGLAQGLILLIASPAGVWLGGRLSERWTRQNMWDCNLRLAIITSLIALPTAILYPLSPSPWLALGLMTFNSFLISMGAGPGAAALQLIVPNQMRGQINSLNLLVFNFSFAFAPTFVALLTDFVFHKEADLRYSIMLVALLINPVSIFITWLGLKPYGRSAKRAHEQFA
jgi:MFS family permease